MARSTDLEQEHAIPERPDRVRARSSATVNERLDRDAEVRLMRLRRASAQEIDRRLRELDQEWDVERALMLLFSGVGALSLGLGARKALPHRKWNGWLSLFSVQLAFVGVHAAYGWCPPVEVLRRLGFRTRLEIDAERRAVEALATTVAGA